MPEKISICLNRGREESVCDDDVSNVRARTYEMVRMTKNRTSRRDRLGRFSDIYCTVILAIRVCLMVVGRGYKSWVVGVGVGKSRRCAYKFWIFFNNSITKRT